MGNIKNIPVGLHCYVSIKLDKKMDDSELFIIDEYNHRESFDYTHLIQKHKIEQQTNLTSS